jgi:hypothetical protein
MAVITSTSICAAPNSGKTATFYCLRKLFPERVQEGKGKQIVYKKKRGYFVTVAFTAATGGLRSVAGVL